MCHSFSLFDKLVDEQQQKVVPICLLIQLTNFNAQRSNARKIDSKPRFNNQNTHIKMSGTMRYNWSVDSSFSSHFKQCTTILHRYIKTNQCINQAYKHAKDGEMRTSILLNPWQIVGNFGIDSRCICLCATDAETSHSEQIDAAVGCLPVERSAGIALENKMTYTDYVPHTSQSFTSGVRHFSFT